MLSLKEATLELWQRKARDVVNALIRRTSGSGPTADRPANAGVGDEYYDTSLGKPIWRHVSGVWKDAGGTTV